MKRLEEKLVALRGELAFARPVALSEGAKVVLFFSFTDGSERATVRTATGAGFDEAWAAGEALVREAVIDRPAKARWLRVDWVDAVQRVTWAELATQLAQIKRNYFRLGIALDGGFRHAFLETELNANAMLYLGTNEASAGLNERNFTRYARLRHGLHDVEFSPDGNVWLFTTRAVFSGNDMRVHPIDGAGRLAGVREQFHLTPDDLYAMVDAGSRYLTSQVQETGRFCYGWHPCFDREIRTYNTLRHASSLFAMIEAWEVTRDLPLKAAIERSAAYLVEHCIVRQPLGDGTPAAWLIDEGNEIKLGGIAAAILALTKYAECFGSTEHRSLLDALGNALLHLQDPETGCFDHVLSFPSLELKQRFRVVYYDGEAVFAMMRLYRLTQQDRWLAAAERAMDYFIADERWRTHDHWLAYCVDEITDIRPKERYFRLGLRNIEGYLDFVERRVTAFPTLLEMMCATERLIAKLRDRPELAHLLRLVDPARFETALHSRAHRLSGSQFWPELAMFYACPRRIVGSFFIRHHGFRVRIDDVEHFLSGLITYRSLLMKSPDAVVEQARDDWSSIDVVRATGGTWLAPPPDGWSARGLCTFAPAFRPGDMVMMRGEANVGVSARQCAQLRTAPAALITDENATLAADAPPVLRVADKSQAVIDLGRYARSRFRGAVIGVTGSAGKTTTVAMLAHALANFGDVAQTRHNANLPRGIAWNLASIPRSTPHIVLEMAIGRMRQNTDLARPDVALFTNILPAHLEFHGDTQTIAVRKARIFEGMRPGGIAVINLDMEHAELVQLAARRHGLRVVTYGASAGADVQLLSYDLESGFVQIRHDGREIGYFLGARGEHMAWNSVAVVATLAALGHPVKEALPTLASFAPIEGRGDIREIGWRGGRITVLNDSYNANPGSMTAAIAQLGAMRTKHRRIAVLGEMLELGDGAADFHSELAGQLLRNGVDKVFATGELYRDFWERLPAELRGAFADSVDELHKILNTELGDGDLVLIKGSHGSGVHALVDMLEGQDSVASAA